MAVDGVRHFIRHFFVFLIQSLSAKETLIDIRQFSLNLTAGDQQTAPSVLLLLLFPYVELATKT